MIYIQNVEKDKSSKYPISILYFLYVNFFKQRNMFDEMVEN